MARSRRSGRWRRRIHLYQMWTRRVIWPPLIWKWIVPESLCTLLIWWLLWIRDWRCMSMIIQDEAWESRSAWELWRVGGRWRSPWQPPSPERYRNMVDKQAESWRKETSATGKSRWSSFYTACKSWNVIIDEHHNTSKPKAASDRDIWSGSSTLGLAGFRCSRPCPTSATTDPNQAGESKRVDESWVPTPINKWWSKPFRASNQEEIHKSQELWKSPAPTSRASQFLPGPLTNSREASNIAPG